jgi:hypothetical protein
MTTAVLGAPPRTRQVTVLRAGAALLVVYSYLVGLWLQQHGGNPQPIAGIREWFNRPLRIGEDFGPLAIMVLLLCTGWTAASAPGTVRDLVRTALPAVVATPIAIAAVAGGLDTPPRAELAFLAAVIGLQLVAWLIGFDRRGWPSASALLACVAVLVVVGGQPLAALGKPALFLTMVLIGHVAHRVADGALPGRAGLLLGVGCFAAVAAVDQADTELGRWWYPVHATYAVLVFLAVVGVPVGDWPVTRWLADRAEWLLVSSAAVGFPVLGLLYLRVPLSVAILSSVVATVLAAAAGHRATATLTRRPA